MLFAIVPAAPPTRKNQRTTSCPAPISAKVPYQRGSRLILSALEWVSIVSSFTSQQSYSELQLVHQSPQGKAERSEDSRRGCHLWPRTGGTPVFRHFARWDLRQAGSPISIFPNRDSLNLGRNDSLALSRHEKMASTTCKNASTSSLLRQGYGEPG